MERAKWIVVAIALAAVAALAVAWSQPSGPIRPGADSRPVKTSTGELLAEEYDGGGVVTELGYNIKVNEKSSLRSRWIILNDQGCPVQLREAGVRTIYKSGSSYSIGEYSYVPSGKAEFRQSIQALEVRFLLFNVFGEHMRTLSTTEVTDLAASSSIELGKAGSWRAWENDVSELLTVVGFVGSVRLVDGSIWRADLKRLLREIDRIKVRLTEKELEPERRRPPSEK